MGMGINRLVFIALLAGELAMSYKCLPTSARFLVRQDEQRYKLQRLNFNGNNVDNANSKDGTRSLMALTPSKISKDDSSSTTSSSSTSLARPTTEGPTLSLLLDNMPTNEKYNILLQSYATKIMSQQSSSSDVANRNNQTLMNTMENLYIEMMQKSVKVERKTAQYMIDASSAFANTIKIGRSLQLIKATGTIKAFGVAIGQLSAICADKRAISKEAKIPTDNRVEEVYWFTGIVVSTVAWFTLELYSKLNEDVHPYATLFGCACALVAAYDIVARKGEGIKLATKGFDRLILKDDEREAHCDSASFLVGYLMGLPCYPYKPDVVESIKMLIENPSSMQVYKQPRAIVAEKRSAAKRQSGGSSNFFSTLLLASTPAPAAPASSSVEKNINIPDMSALISSDSGARSEESMLGLGRVLVWLLSPVAAETLRYGDSIISEPRRASRLLSILESVQQSSPSNSSSNAAAAALYPLPKSAEEQSALLEWAYYESIQLVKIYADVLEELRERLLDSKSSVGECSMFLEDEIS